MKQRKDGTTMKYIREFMVAYDAAITKYANSLDQDSDPAWFLKFGSPLMKISHWVDISLPNLVEYIKTGMDGEPQRGNRKERYVMEKAYGLSWKKVYRLNMDILMMEVLSLCIEDPGYIFQKVPVPFDMKPFTDPLIQEFYVPVDMAIEERSTYFICDRKTFG